METDKFERVGNSYRDLITLLKEKSSVFKQNIEKKVIKINWVILQNFSINAFLKGLQTI